QLRSIPESQLVSVKSLQKTLDNTINRKAMCTKSSRIAIIDDETANIRNLKQSLAEAGYHHVVTTNDSTEAVELIRQEKPDVVLLDIEMPEVSGIDILHMVNVDINMNRVPFIVLTE